MGKLERDLLVAAQVLEARWTVRAKLGGGGFGQVYRAADSKLQKEVAIKIIKVEPRGRKEVLLIEAVVFHDMKGKPHVPGFYGIGGNSQLNFLVMDVLGKNVSDLRRESPGNRACFSKRTTFLLAIQGLEAITDMHKALHLHRDIKPSNYVLGLNDTPRARTLFLIDYGLARPLLDKTGNLRPARANGGFRGTVKYAAIAAHDEVDLGRKDDLWSLFYMIVEMGSGYLPWRKLREKEEVGNAKKTTPLDKLCENVSPKLVRFGKELERYEYGSEPDYTLLTKVLAELLTEAGGDRDSALDWEDNWSLMLKEQVAAEPVLGRKLSNNLTLTGAATGTPVSQDHAVEEERNKKKPKKAASKT